MLNSTVAENTASGLAAGSCDCRTSCQDGGPGKGGGLYSAFGTVNLVNCTFAGNTAIGGPGGSCNYCTCPPLGFPPRPGQTGTANGGGIYVASGDVTILSCTIFGNGAQAYNDFNRPFGGGVYNSGGTVFLINSLIAGNTRNFTTYDGDLGGPLVSQGFNFVGQTTSTGWLSGDLIGTNSIPLDPRLGPLTNNGGPTLTLALPPGSPAIDRGDDSLLAPPFSLATDQRGFSRKSGGHVDIGAYELQQLVLTGLSRSGSDILISFSTEMRQNYRVEWSDVLDSGVWGIVADNVAGTGGIVHAIDSGGANLLQRFYRAAILP